MPILVLFVLEIFILSASMLFFNIYLPSCRIIGNGLSALWGVDLRAAFVEEFLRYIRMAFFRQVPGKFGPSPGDHLYVI